MRAAVAAALVMVATLAAAGCKGTKSDDGAGAASGPERAPAMTPAERKRGQDACTAYVAQLCACAARQPADARLAEQCQMKQAKPEALALLLAVDDDPKASDDSRLRAQIEARKLIARCVMEQAALPSLGCN